MNTTTIEKSIFANASRETVWEYLTDKDKLGEWYHPAEANLEEGLEYFLFAENEDGTKRRQVWGRVLEIEKPSLLVTTFNIPPFDGKETTVTWVLREAAGGTRIHLTHEGIAEASGAAALQLLTALDIGWDSHLGELRAKLT